MNVNDSHLNFVTSLRNMFLCGSTNTRKIYWHIYMIDGSIVSGDFWLVCEKVSSPRPSTCSDKNIITIIEIYIILSLILTPEKLHFLKFGHFKEKMCICFWSMYVCVAGPVWVCLSKQMCGCGWMWMHVCVCAKASIIQGKGASLFLPPIFIGVTNLSANIRSNFRRWQNNFNCFSH